jgi:3-methyladenine DNA glycosylase Mpg
MTCTDCTAAAEKMWHGFQASCRGCAARAVARSPEFALCRKHGVLTKGYGSLCEALGITHEAVKAAAAVDKINNRPQC